MRLMRYVKAALMALVGAGLIVLAVTAMGGTRCGDVTVPDGHLDLVCHAALQTGGREIVFVISFLAVFGWFLGGRHRIPGL